MFKFGFIGAGNMGHAMLKGMLSDKDKSNVIFTAKTKETKEKLKEELGIDYRKNNIELAKEAKYIILAVKPYLYKDVINEIKPHLSKDSVIISITPGFTIDTMKGYLGGNIRVVRTMPNTPSMVGAGMSIVSFSDDDYTSDEIEDIKDLFKSFGEIEVLEEKYMDAVVPVSGSSPAYVYMMIEAMADAGVLTGLPRKLSYKLAAQSVLGAAKMVLDTDTHPGELKDAVCSPGGTTIEAVRILEQRNFRNAIIEAMVSCYEKGKKIV